MKTKIMVVDDDTNMRDLLMTLLEAEGYEVIPAENAAAAHAAFEGPQPDAALLDLQLPDGHGLDLLPTLKKHWPETEVISSPKIPPVWMMKYLAGAGWPLRVSMTASSTRVMI